MNATNCALKRCLPGQRNAALMWSNHFKDLMLAEEFESFSGMPTVYRHKSRMMFLTIHVDDVMLVRGEEDFVWFRSVTTTLTMKSSAPHYARSGDVLYYLKKRISLLEPGILIQPNPSYISKMVELLKVQGKKFKSLPHHTNLEVYDKEKVKSHEFLSPEAQRTFRSGLGLALYIAQDRPDVQQALKVLSTYMAGGTAMAMTALKHLASYLAGTESYGVLLPNTEGFMMCCDHWKRADWENRQDRGQYNIEGYADANWAGCKVSRRSTSSFMLMLNGGLIVSSCKLQTTIALSSAESELYAAASCLAEMIQVGCLVKYLVGDTMDFSQKEQRVRLKLYSDSSSARSIVQRLGQGRLKHIDLRYLWIQEMVKRKVVSVHRVGTIYNISDLNAKKLSINRRRFLMSLLPMALGGSDGQIELITPEEQIDKKQVLRVVLAMLEANCLFGLQGCSPLSGCENRWFLWLMFAVLWFIIFFLSYLVKKAADSTRRFLVASREVRRLLQRRQRSQFDSNQLIHM